VCGRFVSTTTAPHVARWFEARSVVDDPVVASWNVAPGRDVHVVVQAGRERRLRTMRWGLVPSWSTDPSSGPRPINARAESLLDKRVFAGAVAARRCIVPADGFYEWDRCGRPVHLASPAGGPLAFAAVWDRWVSPGGDVLLTVAVVTTAAGPDVSPLHDRMPALLPPSAWSRWLGADVGPSAACSLLRPAPAGTLTARPASPAASSVANDGPELLTPPEEPARLF
jgi:putative SOS response-associated peptidase YedK